MVKVLIDLARYGAKPVSELDAQRLANRVGARTYVESSALTQRNLKEVFDEAIMAALHSSDDLRRLTVGRSRGNRILNSIANWRISQASSDRGGLLRSSRRSKTSKEQTWVSIHYFLFFLTGLFMIVLHSWLIVAGHNSRLSKSPN